MTALRKRKPGALRAGKAPFRPRWAGVRQTLQVRPTPQLRHGCRAFGWVP